MSTNLKLYEGLFLFRQGLPVDELVRAREEIEKLISGAKGKVLDRRDLGRRPLAYPINKRTEGSYAVIEFELDPSQMAPFARAVRLNSKIIRHMLVGKTVAGIAQPTVARREKRWPI